ncbi:Gtr2p [Sugiyamaella lignohabitans]|uniref:GTP-binding protein n=1 Tax=Sugiyamaella lignohabitans TaxID=796027 RepID=A0A167EVT7_9ASCO|nr:Gtr2p [Sugiyamaella lignohabitans]ANB14523.1 Gtr2p [Sugiyamaella lignohabitans]
MQPLETLYIESTAKPTYERFDSLVNFAVQELPGQLDMFEPSYDSERIFAQVGSLIYVIDSQDEYLYALQNLQQIIEYAFKINPAINFEVLIHKVDGLSDDFRLDTQRDIMQRVTDELVDANLEGVNIAFHLTSIFDHSIYEAFSRIIQKLVPELPVLENLLDILCQHSGIEKAFLFDVNSKIYLATDSSPVDVETYQVCSDFIDVAVDLDLLYKPSYTQQQQQPQTQQTPESNNSPGLAAVTNGSGPSQTPEGPGLKCTSKLHNGMVLYLSQMIRGLALVGMIRSEGVQKMTLVDYNVEIFRQGLTRVYAEDPLHPHPA